MSPEILYPLAGAGILTIVFLTWAVGWLSLGQLGSEEDIQNRYLRDFTDDHIIDVDITQDKKAALLSLENTAHIGLVASLGDKMVARRLTKGLIKSVSDDGLEVILKFHDFTWPTQSLKFTTTSDAAIWIDRLKGLREDQYLSNHHG